MFHVDSTLYFSFFDASAFSALQRCHEFFLYLFERKTGGGRVGGVVSVRTLIECDTMSDHRFGNIMIIIIGF